MAAATATRPTTSSFLAALATLLAAAGLTTSTTVTTHRGRRTLQFTGQDGLAQIDGSIYIGAKTGRILSATFTRTYSDDDAYPVTLDSARAVAILVGDLAAPHLHQHDADQPAPAAGDLVIYHGSLADERFVYEALGYGDRDGRPVLAYVGSRSHVIRVSKGCRSITALPLP